MRWLRGRWLGFKKLLILPKMCVQGSSPASPTEHFDTSAVTPKAAKGAGQDGDVS